MTALTQSLDSLIDEQLASGAMSSEAEVELMIISEVANRGLERKLEKGLKQIAAGQCHEASNEFIDGLINEARERLDNK